MTETQAEAALPADAKWSCSFGNAGEGGYRAYFQAPSGKRYVVANGPWDAFAPFNWSVTEA